MGLAVPTAVMVATGRGSELGVLTKGGEALQRTSEITAVVLDKTGTVTEGRPKVISIELLMRGGGATSAASGVWREEDVLRLAASIERLSEHPLADAIVRAADERGLSPFAVSDFQAEPGAGVSAIVVGARSGERLQVRVGTADWVDGAGMSGAARATANRLAHQGQTPVFVACNGDVIGVMGIADPIRETSVAAIAALRRLDLKIVMLTGDRKAAAEAIASSAGITDVIADVRPEGKVAAVEALQRDGHVVAMVGDGINDAPALARADVGIAMGSGTDVALEAADVALMRGDLQALVSAIRVARAALQTMKQNLFWAFVYNVIGIPIAAGVLYPAFGITLSPVLASAAMAFSSVSVVTNSLRLRRVRG
jgi:Cu+-exporting ATPase